LSIEIRRLSLELKHLAKGDEDVELICWDSALNPFQRRGREGGNVIASLLMTFISVQMENMGRSYWNF